MADRQQHTGGYWTQTTTTPLRASHDKKWLAKLAGWQV
jgi:hypothetical protein